MEEIERLQEEVEYWRDRYYEEVERHNEKVEELQGKISELCELLEDVSIKDINHFIWLLKNDGLYNDQLDMFIEEYMKWHND